jgi:hypothetical protein
MNSYLIWLHLTDVTSALSLAIRTRSWPIRKQYLGSTPVGFVSKWTLTVVISALLFHVSALLRGESLSVATTLRTGESGFDFRQGHKVLLLSSASTTPSSLSKGCRGSPRGRSHRGVKITTYLHQVPRLTMRGATPPFLMRLWGLGSSWFESQKRRRLLWLGFSWFSSVCLLKCRDSISNWAIRASLHILSNSSFTYHLTAWRRCIPRYWQRRYKSLNGVDLN